MIIEVIVQSNFILMTSTLYDKHIYFDIIFIYGENYIFFHESFFRCGTGVNFNLKKLILAGSWKYSGIWYLEIRGAYLTLNLEGSYTPLISEYWIITLSIRVSSKDTFLICLEVHTSADSGGVGDTLSIDPYDEEELSLQRSELIRLAAVHGPRFANTMDWISSHRRLNRRPGPEIIFGNCELLC